MSINACSINAGTINSLRCRTIIIAPPIPSTQTRGPKSIPAMVRQRAEYHVPVRREEPEVELDLSKIESPYVEIKVEMLGQTYIYNYENTPYEFTPTIMATGITMTEFIPTISVTDLNISDK